MIDISSMEHRHTTQEPHEPLVAAIYARVSTGGQEREETIESQIDEIKKRIEADNNKLSDENIYVDDGWTGEMLQRPALDQMRDSAVAGRFQVLYVYDRGRLSRVFTYQEIILEDLLDREIKFVSLHDINALTPEEHVMQSMQGVFHEYERVKIAERMRRGKLYKAKNGIIISGNALYGYSYIKKSDKNNSAQWVVNEVEAEIVRMIWNWVGVEGESIRGVIKRLYNLGIKPRKTKRDIWTKGPVIRILQCETYISGLAYYYKSEAIVAKNPLNHNKYKKVKRTSRKVRPFSDWIPFNVPTIVSDKWLYEKIQNILELNKKYANRKSKGKYLLTGRLFCQCGSRMNGDGSNKYGHYYYRCTSRIHKFPLESHCKAGGVNSKILDEVLWRELEKHITDSMLMRQYAQEWLESRNAKQSNVTEVDRIQGLLEGLHEEEKRFSLAYGHGSLELDQFHSLMLDIRKRKTPLNAQLQFLSRSQKQAPQVVEIDELLDEAVKVVQELDLDNKIGVVRDIIDRVVVREQTGVEVFVHLPMPTTQKLDYELENRYRRASQCRQKYAV